MVTAVLNNAFTRLDAPADVIKELDELTSYPVEGAEWVPSFRKGFWDGKEHLLRRSRKHRGQYLVPTGVLAEKAVRACLGTNVEWIDERRPMADPRDIEWVGHEPRDYQEAAVEAAIQDRGLWTGRGLENLPIRSGKTIVAGIIIARTGRRSLFIVPSDMLLLQTVKEFRKSLRPAPVGIFGAGVHKPDWITVATIQSIMSRADNGGGQLVAEADNMFIDEAHHLEGEAWRQPVLHCDARTKVGLSATISVSRKRQNQRSSIWLKACTGPIISRISMSRLIKAGHLMKPRVLFYRIEHDGGEHYGWQKAQKELMAESYKRNAAIADLTEDAVSRGLRVLIDTGRLAQMRAIREMVAARGIRIEMIHGKVKPTKRWDKVEEFQRREIKVIIGTVFGEGVDIPELEVVINAEGQASRTAALQRMRNLTPSEGKGECLFIDFADMTNPHLRRHSLARLKVYRSIRGFSVKLCNVDASGRYLLPTS